MDKNTKITLAELIKRKEQVLEAKKNVKRAESLCKKPWWRDCYKSTDKVACNRIGGNGKGR